MIPIGTKVLIMTNKGDTNLKHRMDGHICTIKNIVREPIREDVFKKTYPYYYELHWNPNDNPGKRFPVDEIDFHWFDDDFRFYVPKTAATTVGLPDF